MPQLLAERDSGAAADREFMVLFVESVVACWGRRKGTRLLKELERRALRARDLGSVSLIRANPQVAAARADRARGAERALAALPWLSACLPPD